MDIPVRLRESRPTRLVVLLGLVATITLSAWLAFAVLRSLRQRTVVMAIYPEGSLNVELVKRYQQVLARKGLEVKLDESAGAVESLSDLRNPKSGVSVALVPGGIATKQDLQELVSLGTVLYRSGSSHVVAFHISNFNLLAVESPSDLTAVAPVRSRSRFSGARDGSTKSQPRC